MSVKWLLNPCEDINDIKFGSNRADVREKLGTNYTEFKKNKFSKNTTDDYGNFQVFYDDNNRLEAVEIFEDIELFVGEKQIFPSGVEDLKALFEDIIIENDELTSVKYSIGATIEKELIVSILVGCKGYYL